MFDYLSLEEIIDILNYLDPFLSSIERWLEKASNHPIIKGNLPPFTLTGDFNDAVFPMSLTNKLPWWILSTNRTNLTHSLSELYLHDSQLSIGSWCNYDDAHDFYQKLVDRDIQFRDRKYKKLPKETNLEQTNADTTTANTSRVVSFSTHITRGTVAWDITEDRELLKEYERRRAGRKPLKSDRHTASWIRFLNKSVPLISDIKEGKIDMKSDIVQGRIGTELKTRQEIRKRNELDDPNNEIWTRKRISSWRNRFIQMKIRNTIKWEEFCARHDNQQ